MKLSLEISITDDLLFQEYLMNRGGFKTPPFHFEMLCIAFSGSFSLFVDIAILREVGDHPVIFILSKSVFSLVSMSELMIQGGSPSRNDS